MGEFIKDDLTNSLSLEEKTFLDSIGAGDVSGNYVIDTQDTGTPTFTTISDNHGQQMFDRIVENMNEMDNSGFHHDKNDNWTELSEDDITEMFSCFINYDEPSIDLSKFDFRTHTADWYREKYPHFDDRFYKILEEASEKKLDDKRDGGLRIIEKETTLKFD